MNLKSIKTLSTLLAGASFVMTLIKGRLEVKIDEHETREIVRDELKKMSNEAYNKEEES